VPDGGGVIRGSGGKLFYFRKIEYHGIPRAYVFANFTNSLDRFILDNRGVTTPINQGGHIYKGKPGGEAAIRICNYNHCLILGVKTTAWKYDGKHYWKQVMQLRPDSGTAEVIQCDTQQIDDGDMAWRKPAHKVGLTTIIDSVLELPVHLTPGNSGVQYKNTAVAGKIRNDKVK
jgi:hypothetical protein